MGKGTEEGMGKGWAWPKDEQADGRWMADDGRKDGGLWAFVFMLLQNNIRLMSAREGNSFEMSPETKCSFQF